MPNPVLLGQNTSPNAPAIVVQPRLNPGGMSTGTFEIQFTPPSPGQEHSLWILDGQHRINGLANSLQQANAIPVVLLLNAGGNYYTPPLLAKIFAQVTTGAEKLDVIHDEWLKFSFGLGHYSGPNAHNEKQAMEAVAELCKRPIAGGLPNPFADQIKFNPKQHVSPVPGGFCLTCVEFKELLREHYYAQHSPAGAHLSPVAIGDELVKSHHALVAAVNNHSSSVFFGGTPKGHRIMQDAFIAGICASLLTNGIPPAGWQAELNQLKFPSTSWDFQSWTRSLNGEDARISKKLAVAVMREAFKTRRVPLAGSTIADALRGNNSEFTLDFSRLNAAGRVLPSGRQSTKYVSGNTTTASIPPRSHIKVSHTSVNIGALTITDKQSAPGRLTRYDEMLGRGLKLDSTIHNNPLQLLFEMKHYGGNTSVVDLSVIW